MMSRSYWKRTPTSIKILGQDDWLIFARKAEGDGTLVYTVIETDYHWLDTPHKGQCWNEETGRNCDGETMSTCRIDNLWMQFYIEHHPDEYSWRECDYDKDGTYLGWRPEKDEEFIKQSEETYLPRRSE